MRGGKCSGFTFGKDGVAPKNQPKYYDQKICNYGNIDRNTGKKVNFADKHQTTSGNMFGKAPVNKKEGLFKYQAQYDMGNYTHQFRHEEGQYFDQTQYYHKRNTVNFNQEQRPFTMGHDNSRSKYMTGLRTYKKHISEEELRYLRKLFHLEQEHSKPQNEQNIQNKCDNSTQNQYNNKNQQERSFNIVSGKEYDQKEKQDKKRKNQDNKIQKNNQILHEIESQYF